MVNAAPCSFVSPKALLQIQGNSKQQNNRAMKHICTWMALLVLLLHHSSAQATDANFFDYLPKYRKIGNHFQLDKIEYRDKRTILYFRQVVTSNSSVYLHSGNHPDSWYLRTPPRTRGIEVQFKLMELRDIRINNDLKLESLSSVPEIEYKVKKGDVVTYEMHFARVPNYIKMLDLIQGKDGDLDDERMNCFDIMIKTKDSPLLGSPENAQTTASRLEQSFTYVQPKKEPAKINPEPSKAPNKIQQPSNTPEPIDYMPKQLVKIEDLRCSERVVLPQIKFRDNEVSFAGRAKAMQDVQVLAEFMRKYPDSRLRLHGHTDIFGDQYRNLELSRDRAMAVKQALIDYGIRAERIEVFYYGGQYPLPSFEKGNEANRRVEAEPVCGPKNDGKSGPQIKVSSSTGKDPFGN